MATKLKWIDPLVSGQQIQAHAPTCQTMVTDVDDTAGCEQCRAWVRAIDHGPMLVEDVAHRFERKFDYFSARVFSCPECECSWLSGYYEDFTDTPIEAEWGRRTWILRPLTNDDLRSLDAGERLNIDTFAAK